MGERNPKHEKTTKKSEEEKMTEVVFKPIDPNFILSRGNWLLVFQNIAVPQLFEKKNIRILLWKKLVSDYNSPGYRIVSVQKI